ncbi:YIP1 family protein [Streptomyces sp. F001]|uniref:Yip1 family protein n=1 Tax=Streptomyces sp. F001 TaxID=1510026 RepID=UPI001F0E31D5|nr:YIP1 family protein [Streptomyces sp. F001]
MGIAKPGDNDDDLPDWLTAAEVGMWRAFRNGSVYDLSSGDTVVDDPHGGHLWGPERTVRARMVCWLLLDGPPALAGRVSSLKLTGVRISGSLDLAGGSVTPYVELRDCRFEQEVLLPEARFKTVRLVNCSVPRLEAARVHTEGDLHLPRCRFLGGARLTDAQIGTDLLLNQAVVHRDRRGKSLIGDGMTVGQDLQAEMLVSYGELSLRGAKVGVSLSLRGSRLVNPYGPQALNAPQLTVGRTLYLTPTGHVYPVQTSELPPARGTQVQRFECQGGIRLDDGRFGDAVDFEQARLILHDDQEVSLRRVQTPELRFTVERPERGTIVLSGMRVGNLVDRSASWPGPGQVLIDGFVYDNLMPVGSFPLEERLAWLADATSEYSSQPYEQLAATYRRTGDDHAASRVRRAQRRRLRADLPWPRRAWHALRDVPGISVTLWAIIVIALLVVAWLSTRAVLQDISNSAELGPSDAPPVVVAIVSVITASGVLIGGILNGLAKFVRARGQNASDIVQARGQADADLIRAQAEMRRAEADILRAHAGLPPAEPLPPDPSITPGTDRIAPPARSGDEDGAALSPP